MIILLRKRCHITLIFTVIAKLIVFWKLNPRLYKSFISHVIPSECSEGKDNIFPWAVTVSSHTQARTHGGLVKHTFIHSYRTALMEFLVYVSYSSRRGYTTVDKTKKVLSFLKLTKSSREDRPQVNKQTKKSVIPRYVPWENVIIWLKISPKQLHRSPSFPHATFILRKSLERIFPIPKMREQSRINGWAGDLGSHTPGFYLLLSPGPQLWDLYVQ